MGLSNDHSAYNTAKTGIYIGSDYISLGGGESVTVFTLPTDYRPAYTRTYVCRGGYFEISRYWVNHLSNKCSDNIVDSDKRNIHD